MTKTIEDLRNQIDINQVEMGKEELVKRLLSGISMVSLEEIDIISKSLKAMAKELDVPVMSYPFYPGLLN